MDVWAREVSRKALQACRPSPELAAEAHTLYPTGACSHGVAGRGFPLWRLALVDHVGLGGAGLGWDAFEGLDEVVLVGELEHTFLGKKGQSHRSELALGALPTHPRGPSCRLRPHRSQHS